MRRLVTGECLEENKLDLVDPTMFSESQFEVEVVKALTCLNQDYWCGVFSGAFVLEGSRRAADLALIHKSLSHWFVVEVEIAGHSLEQHILPQVRCFRYGDPDVTCATSLMKAFDIFTRPEAESFLRHIPRYVAVVGNKANPTWSVALRALEVQYLTVSVFAGKGGQTAHEVDGELLVKTRSLGFARYSAIDNCLRFKSGRGLVEGRIRITDQFGNSSDWTIREESNVLWISKDRGDALLQHDSYVQIIQTLDGRIVLQPSYPRSENF